MYHRWSIEPKKFRTVLIYSGLFFVRIVDMNGKFDVTGIKLETERLILREWKFSDLYDFFAYASVPGVGKRAGWPHHENRKASLTILNCLLSISASLTRNIVSLLCILFN